jgi:hypothetical protein
LRWPGMPDSPTAAPKSAPSTQPRWTFSPPQLALARTAASKSSAYLLAKWISDG